MKPGGEGKNGLLSARIDEASQSDAPSARSTSRERHGSFSRSEGTPSEPSSGDIRSFDGSEMSGSLDLDVDESGSDSDF